MDFFFKKKGPGGGEAAEIVKGQHIHPSGSDPAVQALGRLVVLRIGTFGAAEAGTSVPSLRFKARPYVLIRPGLRLQIAHPLISNFRPNFWTWFIFIYNEK